VSCSLFDLKIPGSNCQCRRRQSREDFAGNTKRVIVEEKAPSRMEWMEFYSRAHFERERALPKSFSSTKTRVHAAQPSEEAAVVLFLCDVLCMPPPPSIDYRQKNQRAYRGKSGMSQKKRPGAKGENKCLKKAEIHWHVSCL